MITGDATRILLVEDSPNDALLLRKSLQAAAPDVYAIQHVFSLRDALRALADTVFEVVLLDLHLPDVVEFSGLQNILQSAPRVPVIILTGHHDEAMAVRGVEMGAQDYLFKDNSGGAEIKRAIQYAIKRKQLEGELAAKANFDPLTGLSNRSSFESRLGMAIARSKRHPIHIGVFFMDLDRFKQVNDTLGHAAGDTLLKGVAERIKQCVRPYDTAARFGGDEFAVLVEDIGGKEDCTAVANKIIAQVTTPFSLQKQEVNIGVSIGIATNIGREQTSESIVRQADQAMYEAKRASGSCYRFGE